MIKFIMAMAFALPMKQGLTQKLLSDTTRPKPYLEVITNKALTYNGLIVVHEIDNKFFFEIPEFLLGKDLLIVTRIERSSPVKNSAVQEDLYPGDEVSSMVVSFEKINSRRVFLRKKIYSSYAGDSTSAMYKTVVRSNLMPAVAAFSIEAVNSARHSLVIDVTNFLTTDDEPVSFNGMLKGLLQLHDILPDRSYISKILTYPENIEIIAEKTFTQSQPVSFYNVSSTINQTASYEFHTSIILLPQTPMHQRFSDARVGYFSVRQIDFDDNPQGTDMRSYIQRWRLEPRSEDLEKYKNGILVEPKKPIIFYIDPTTPSKWIPYLMQGVTAWEKAFEQAGFKNAIQARNAPTKTEDSTWNLFDARHSAIVYKPSEIENASGPAIYDPRSGEILESHINWYHDVMQLVHRWYMLQCGATDTKARKWVFDDSLMGKLIRFVAAHEVGHTLGLQHNMGASYSVPVDSLRDKHWVEQNGICPSIMDYARFNYVAQPEDSISEDGLIGKVGVYDRWAIEYGYRLFPQYNSPEKEKHYLNEWIIEKTKDRKLKFQSETSWDPRAQREDLSDNIEKANELGIKNLKYVLAHLVQWTAVPDESYSNLNEMYNAVQNRYIIYLKQVAYFLGASFENLKATEEPGPIYQPVPRDQQEQAMKFLDKYLCQPPKWLLDSAILNRTGQTASGVMANIQNEVIQSIFFPPLNFIAQVSRNESIYGKKTYALSELLENLKQHIWTELYNNQSIPIYRRSLQRTYIFNLLISFEMARSFQAIISFPISGKTFITSHDVGPLLESHVRDLQRAIKSKISRTSDKPTLDHLRYLETDLKLFFEKQIK